METIKSVLESVYQLFLNIAHYYNITFVIMIKSVIVRERERQNKNSNFFDMQTYKRKTMINSTNESSTFKNSTLMIHFLEFS